MRPESRTLRLARRLLDHLGGQVTEVDLQREALRPLDAETLGRRDALLARGETDDPMLRYARQLAAAKQIVVAAPYWDLSFSAELLDVDGMDAEAILRDAERRIDAFFG